MKTMQAVLLLLTMFTGIIARAQDTTINKESAIQQLIESKNYTFQAQYAVPLGGRQILLTTEYTLTVKGDSLVSYLPYFGRAYVAPINPQDNGIEFTSTDFDYKAEKTKKGNYDITIKPKQESKASQLMLSVLKNGYTTLQVLSVNRQQIFF